MKNIILLLISVLSTNIISSQNQEWFSYDLDTIISIEMPGEAFELDTIAEGMRMYQIFSHTETATFLVQKTRFEKENQNEDLSNLPYDLISLKKQYNEMIKGIAKGIPYELESKEMIERDKFKGYRLRFKDSANNPTYESEIYLLNKHLYSFYYVSTEDFNKSEKELFFNSIKINTDHKISQFLGKAQSYRIGYVFGKFSFFILIFGGIVYFLIKKKKK